MAAFAGEHGLASRLQKAQPASRERFLLRAGRLVPVPMSLFAFARTPLLTRGGKLRLLAEPFQRGGDPTGESVAEFAKRTGLPAEAALVGGAGEYELLFATSEDLAESSRNELEKMGMTAIADLSMNASPGVLVYRAGNLAGTMTSPPPCPRAAETVSEHVKAVAGFAAALFGGEEPK
jgi:hypothetical protein